MKIAHKVLATNVIINIRNGQMNRQTDKWMYG